MANATPKAKRVKKTPRERVELILDRAETWEKKAKALREKAAAILKSA